jgi:hypothetical protein
MRSVIVLLLAGLSSTASADKQITAKSGAAMCVLTADDFKAAGVANAGKPTTNVSDPANVYCVYNGKSSATGGIELDVFFPAGASDADIKETEKTAGGETGLTKPLKLPGVDTARWSPTAKSGGPEFAVTVVRRGSLVFVLGVPKHADSEAQLTKLSTLVLARLAK